MYSWRHRKGALVNIRGKLQVQILQQKDESFYQKKSSHGFQNLNDFDFVLKLYSQASSINSFLRNPSGNDNPESRSNVWCLHKAITESASNVENNITVYRGVNVKMPNNVGIGTKFYFKDSKNKSGHSSSWFFSL